MNEYDVVVIGAGPGGYVCAIRASQLGLKAAIVDKEWLGGVCLNVGCIPSKSLLKNAELAHTLRERAAEFGISFDNLQLDYGKAVARSRQVSERLTKGIAFLMKKNNIDVYMGKGKLLSKNKVQVEGADGVQELSAKNIVIATGSHAFQVPGIAVDGEKIVSYREAILQSKLPASAVIIGAGAIGVEFSTVWSAYGSKVTLVEMLPRIVPLEDEEISAELAKQYRRRGIKMLTSTKVLGIETTDTGVKVKISSEKGEDVLEAEQALVAVGFRPNTKEIGLEEAGVAVSPRGFVEVNDQMATNVPGVWAIGDVTGKVLLAHVASTQAMVCAEAMAGQNPAPLNYTMMPHTTFSNPQVASFGMTEAMAKEAGRDIKIGRFNFMANGKALGMGEGVGYVKLITDAKYGEILGAHMIGPEVAELLPELTLAQKMELTAAEIASNVHSHPTLSEVVMEAAHDVQGHLIHG